MEYLSLPLNSWANNIASRMRTNQERLRWKQFAASYRMWKNGEKKRDEWMGSGCGSAVEGREAMGQPSGKAWCTVFLYWFFVTVLGS